MNAQEFDELLSENCSQPEWMMVDYYVWNGYWKVNRTNKFLRWFGRKLHNKYIYWLGLQVKWQIGFGEYLKTIGLEW